MKEELRGAAQVEVLEEEIANGEQRKALPGSMLGKWRDWPRKTVL